MERAGNFPYTCEVLYVSVDNAKNIVDLETYYKRYLKPYKYIPLKPFGGRFECFARESLPDVKVAILKLRYDKVLAKGCLKKYHSTFEGSWDKDKDSWLELYKNYSIEDNVF